ncbi:hypothetical protein ACIP93_33565 [Streptomyces sp. NPDC088745]|uniref:hypothetical protein n=1 Tax=Streptomyces sp. NPDC088745 TaxID=3365884 RepID=UPI00382C74C2
MYSVDFTPKDIPVLRRVARFLRGKEVSLPNTAHAATHRGVLISAFWLDDQADELGAAPAPTAQETRAPIFTQLVSAAAGDPVSHDKATALLNAYEDAIRGAAEEELLRLQSALLAMHPKTPDPRHGCCARPKLCSGHRPECRSSEHTLGGLPWPCKTLRAAGIRTDADADRVRKALARLDRAADPGGYPGRKKVPRGRAVHATKGCEDGIGDIGACGMYFDTRTESSVEDPDTAVSCQACIKALVRKERGAAAVDENAHRCTLPPARRLPCGCCLHQVCADCEQCAHKCECGTGGTPAE